MPHCVGASCRSEVQGLIMHDVVQQQALAGGVADAAHVLWRILTQRRARRLMRLAGSCVEATTSASPPTPSMAAPLLVHGPNRLTLHFHAAAYHLVTCPPAHAGRPRC